MRVSPDRGVLINPNATRGRVIKELGLRRTDLIITTKIFWGIGRKGPNDGGLSRKQYVVFENQSFSVLGIIGYNAASLRERENPSHD